MPLISLDARRRHPLAARPAAAALARRAGSRPELLSVLGAAAALNLWSLSINGWANTYYSAAVRSMAASWHDFLFAAMDRAGLMTVDKPPLSLWVQALSVRVFGYHPLAVLLPQAAMGIAAAGLLYDLVGHRFGRAAGAVAGLALATTPVIVGVSRHNNPDELLVLLSVATVWAALRGFERDGTRWFVLAGLLAGLAFETKMLIALAVVPGIAVAWLWVAPRGRLAALRQLLAGGSALLAAGLAWPVLVWLTPAAARPWVSGTSDNSIWSLIFGYNGLGRVSGQAGGPPGAGAGGAGGGSLFGGATGPFRLLQSGLGDQAGWLIGCALVIGIALLALTRLRRTDPRTGWLIAVGGAAVATLVVFSFASGIFHPYYVSLFAPFAAALVGAGVPLMLGGGPVTRTVAPLAIAGGVATEIAVLAGMNGALGWAVPLVAVAGAVTAAALASGWLSGRAVTAAVAVALATLLAAPAVWAAETVGHAENGTFPAGGPRAAGPGTRPGGRFGPPAGGFGPPAGGFGPPAGGFGPPAGGFGPPPGAFAGPGAGGPLTGDRRGLDAAIAYARAHGGGVIGVESQSSAAAAIVRTGADVAGLGGFSGRESSVTTGWLASEVAAGRLRFIVTSTGGGPRLPGDTRAGSRTALSAVAAACRKATAGSGTTVYDCTGRAAALRATKS